MDESEVRMLGCVKTPPTNLPSVQTCIPHTSNAFNTSSPQWLTTFTAILPVFSLFKGRLVALYGPLHADSSNQSAHPLHSQLPRILAAAVWSPETPKRPQIPPTRKPRRIPPSVHLVAPRLPPRFKARPRRPTPAENLTRFRASQLHTLQ